MATAPATAAVYWFIAFSGALGAPADEMRPGLAVGPFALRDCYLHGAELLDRLAQGFVGEDFRGACWTEKLVERRPGMEILDAGELRARWGLMP